LTESDQRRRCFSNALAPGSIGEEIKSVFSMDPIGESEILRHLHEAGVDSHLALHPNTPEWDLTVGNHVANDETTISGVCADCYARFYNCEAIADYCRRAHCLRRDPGPD
jgi:hypothetical protein